MSRETDSGRTFDQHLGCFGHFQMNDPVCRNRCALRLRCLIERDQNVRTELMEEMMAFDQVAVKTH